MKSIIQKAVMNVAVASMAMTFGGCGTVMNGSESTVSFNSVPRGNITIDGEKFGKTPVSVKLSNKKEHYVHIEADGHRPYDGKIEQSFSFWSFVGGLPGLVIDSMTGGMWYLSPTKFNATLVKVGLQKNLSKDLESGKLTIVH